MAWPGLEDLECVRLAAAFRSGLARVERGCKATQLSTCLPVNGS